METCDYVSVNGDFQSYNVFRRILAGQTPYVDFANYVGMAPVVLNLPLVALNNSFANSLFVTNFTAALLFSVTVLLVFGWSPLRPLPPCWRRCSCEALPSGLLGTAGGAAGGYLTGLFESPYTLRTPCALRGCFCRFCWRARRWWLKARRCGWKGTRCSRPLARRAPCLVWGLAAGWA